MIEAAPAAKPTKSRFRLILWVGCLFWALLIVSYVLEGLLGLVDDNLLIIVSILGALAGIAWVAAGLFLLLAVPATAWRGIAQHGLFSRRWLAKPMLCLVFVAGFWAWRDIRSSLDDWRFQWELPDYLHVVEQVKAAPAGTPDGYVHYIGPASGLPGGAGGFGVERCGQGQVIVRFMIPALGGALGPHWGYLYDECSEAAPGAEPAGYAQPHESYRHIQGPWYRFFRP